MDEELRLLRQRVEALEALAATLSEDPPSGADILIGRKIRGDASGTVWAMQIVTIAFDEQEGAPVSFTTTAAPIRAAHVSGPTSGIYFMIFQANNRFIIG